MYFRLHEKSSVIAVCVFSLGRHIESLFPPGQIMQKIRERGIFPLRVKSLLFLPGEKHNSSHPLAPEERPQENRCFNIRPNPTNLALIS